MSRPKAAVAAPVDSFARVAAVLGVDTGRVRAFAAMPHARGLNVKDIYRAAGGQERWNEIVLRELDCGGNSTQAVGAPTIVTGAVA